VELDPCQGLTGQAMVAPAVRLAMAGLFACAVSTDPDCAADAGAASPTLKPQSFDAVTLFENELANFYGAKYAVATDCCTHAIELSLRYLLDAGQLAKDALVAFPKRTYISIPFLGNKLDLNWTWKDEQWQDYYYLGGTNVVDAAVLFREGSYVEGTFMCISFQFQKHLSLGRGGVILTDDFAASEKLRRMVYDGRARGIPWRSQDIDTMGYHYYMTPETAELGLSKFEAAKESEVKIWKVTDWPDLSKLKVFQKQSSCAPFLPPPPPPFPAVTASPMSDCDPKLFGERDVHRRAHAGTRRAPPLEGGGAGVGKTIEPRTECATEKIKRKTYSPKADSSYTYSQDHYRLA